MGEAKQEEAKAEAKVEEKKEEKEEKKEEKKEEEKKEEKKEEEAKPPPPPPPPPPVILYVDMHCVGCAKKIERCLLKCKGVEEVESDMANNQLKIKGVVDPQALCSRLQKKTLRSARVISPVPPPDQEAAAEPKPQVVASQVSGVSTVELHVNMHCEACAQQLRRKILKMRGVQAAETELSSGRVTVTGTMTGDKLVDYIYRRTGKLAKVIPPPPPPPPPPKEEEKKDEDKPEDQKPPEEKKEEEKPAAEEKKEDNAEKKEEEKATAPPEAESSAAAEEKKEEKKEGELGMQANMQYTGPEDLVKRMMYWNGGYNNYTNYMGGGGLDDDYAKRMMPQLPWMPVYVIERPPPPPQMFSDENPNACCIS